MVAMVTQIAVSQPPDRPGNREGRNARRPEDPPMNPVIELLDADHNHEISSEEIANATAVLKKLDRNQDGRLTPDEFHPAGAGEGRPGVGRPDAAGGPFGRGRPPAEGDAGGDRARRPGASGDGGFVERIMAMDENKDGKLSKDELPERMQRMIERADMNEDGFLSQEELKQMSERMGQRRGGAAGGRPDGQGRPGPAGGSDRPREGGDANSEPPGGRDADGFIERLLSFDENEDGKLSKEELPERMQGMIEGIDANKDGVIDKGEMEQMGQQFGQSRGGRPGGDRPDAGQGRPGGRSPQGRGGGGTAGRGGPPSPEQFIERAMSFDADKDGKLDQAELKKMAEGMAQRGRPSGASEGRGGFGRRPGGEGGDRPRRPGDEGADRPRRPGGEGADRPSRPDF